ncbi:MAG: hypothetical protein V1708_05775 [Candidatus Micrarchaeota archaeon]
MRGKLVKRRGFFSFAVIAAVTAAIILLAAYARSWNDYRNTQIYDLEARLVSQRANDSARFLSGMLDDAILDGEYNKLGCGWNGQKNATDACDNITKIFHGYLNATANLSSNGTTFYNTSPYVIECGNSTWTSSAAGASILHNTSLFFINLTANFTVNTTNARMHVDAFIDKMSQINISRSGALHGNYFNTSINGSYGRTQGFYANCT